MFVSEQKNLVFQGWYLSQEGIQLCTEGLSNPSSKDVIKKVNLLNLNLNEESYSLKCFLVSFLKVMKKRIEYFNLC